jgi:hypothetical protein
MNAPVNFNLYRRQLLERESDNAGWISLGDAGAQVLSKLRDHVGAAGFGASVVSS